MSISTVEENQIPESYSLFTLVHFRKPADGTGAVTLAAAGRHPKCRLVKGQSVVLAYSTAADVAALERGSGEDVATVTCGAAIGVSADFTIAPAAGTKNVFERDEDIVFNLTTDGNAANADIFAFTFESIH
ncbi:MAG TPA: hypothetical protein VN368_01005 [Candidatus Methylomirabilis sp.]|nr:hypothetical protein [Candidatus Methylomirabilis sp.]